MNETWTWVAVAAAVVMVLLVLVMVRMASHRRRTQALHDQFGPEYDRVVGDTDGRRGKRAAEGELSSRADDRDDLEIVVLAPGARERYAARWQETQAKFVDAPGVALAQAGSLLDEVMADRGYPVDDFDRQTDLISVDHPRLVENYRAAHAEQVRAEQGDGGSDTEAMRDAMLRYRSLFDELLTPEATPVA